MISDFQTTVRSQSHQFDSVVAALGRWCESHGIEFQEQVFPAEKVGQFDGVSVTMNSVYDAEQRTYYLAHAIGSIVRRSLDAVLIQRMFDELRDAKKAIDDDPQRLDLAIGSYRAFEAEASEFAVWLLADRGFPGVVPTYTNFMRADLEAMTLFHRQGRAPIWREFFSQWNKEVAVGKRQVLSFESRPIPRFKPVKAENQEILQRQ